MSILTCNSGSWSLFDDPIPDEVSIADEVLNRITNEEKYSKVEASAYEKKITHIKRFLRKNSFDVESTLGMWSEWVAWRRSTLVDSITDDEIAFERTEGTMSWRGNLTNWMNDSHQLFTPVNNYIVDHANRPK